LVGDVIEMFSAKKGAFDFKYCYYLSAKNDKNIGFQENRHYSKKIGQYRRKI
jgi:hypothetical protein